MRRMGIGLRPMGIALNCDANANAMEALIVLGKARFWLGF